MQYLVQKGGVHPPDQKVFSREQGIVRLPLPSELGKAFPAYGGPCKPLKAKGDTLTRGRSANCRISVRDVHSMVGVARSRRSKRDAAEFVQCDAFAIRSMEAAGMHPPIDWRKLRKEILFASSKSINRRTRRATFPSSQ